MRCINKRVAVAAVGQTSRQREIETELRAFELDVELLELSGGYQRMYPRGDRLSKVEAEVQDASRALPSEVIWSFGVIWCHLVTGHLVSRHLVSGHFIFVPRALAGVRDRVWR